MSAVTIDFPTVGQLRQETRRVWGFDICEWQIEPVFEVLKREKDVFLIQASGNGKSVPLFLPCLFHDGISIIVSPLNILSDQEVEILNRLGVNAISLKSQGTSQKVYKDIRQRKYRVIIVPPGILSTDDRFLPLIQDSTFSRWIFDIKWDDAHCISRWSSPFQLSYWYIGSVMRWNLPPSVRFYINTATASKEIYDDIVASLFINPKQLKTIRYSNDRPNIFLAVWKMQHKYSSFKDLEFLVPLPPDGERLAVEAVQALDPFICFGRSNLDTERMVALWQSRAVPEARRYFVWIHSAMSDHFIVDTIARFKQGKLIGLAAADAVGMSLDLPNVKIVVNLGIVDDLCTIIWRAGRAGRSAEVQAKFILIVEKEYFKEEIPDRGRMEMEKPNPQKLQDRYNTLHAPLSEPQTSKDAALASVSNTEQKALDSTTLLKTQDWHESTIGVIQENVLMFINPPNGCRRKFCLDFFLSHEPDPNPCSCLRCSVTPAVFCCDLCHPDFYKPPEPIYENKPAKAKRTSTSTLVITGESERSLEAELLAWRDRFAEAKYGSIWEYAGSHWFMSSPLLERIVLLCRLHPNMDINILKQEVDWPLIDSLGASLLDCITAWRIASQDKRQGVLVEVDSQAVTHSGPSSI